VTGDSGTSFYNRAEKTTNYEITQVESREVLAPGEVKRISLSVLVDGVTDPAKLASLKTVITAAAGIDEARGDSLAVETLAFDRSYYEAEATGLEEEGQQDLYFRIGEAVAAGLLLLLLLWYVQRLLKNLRLASSREWAPVLQTVPDLALAGGQPAGGSTALPSAAPEGLSIPQLEQTLAKAFANHQPLPEPAKPAVTYQLPKMEQTAFSEEYRQLQDYIDDLADQDASTLAEIIQIWLNEDERRNG
jgi:flagellar M-ring protein FliF